MATFPVRPLLQLTGGGCGRGKGKVHSACGCTVFVAYVDVPTAAPVVAEALDAAAGGVKLNIDSNRSTARGVRYSSGPDT